MNPFRRSSWFVCGRSHSLSFHAVLPVMLVWCSVAVAAGKGRWTPSVDWSDSLASEYAVHLALLPGDGAPYHSRVLFWSSNRKGTVLGGQMGWKPGSDDGCIAFPNASFDTLGLPHSGMDIFCAGHLQMPQTTGLLVIGGTDSVTGDFGDNRVRIFTPGAGSQSGTWSAPNSLKTWRWYSGSVGLRDGRLVAMAADMHRRHLIFGGRTSVSEGPQGDSLYRFAPVDGGAWWPAVIPEPDGSLGLPVPREGHSGTRAGGPFSGQVYFGGRNSNGEPLNDSWILRREQNPLGSDPRYEWKKRPVVIPGNAPAPRSEHCAVAALDQMLVVWGGLDENNTAIVDPPRRLRFDSQTGLFVWSEMTITGTGPSARFGHAAVYDVTTMPDTTFHRMIVFGGVGALGAVPSDTTIYELRFNPLSPNDAEWLPMTQVNLHPGIPGPAPRYGHSLTWDSNLRNNFVTQQQGHAALMYGGALGNGAYSGELWVLWTLPDGRVGWQPLVPGNSSASPGPRARHSATIDPGQGGRLYIFGGETGTLLADAYVHAVDPWPLAAPGQWMQWDDAIAARTRQAALIDDGDMARVPEVFDPATGQWTPQTSAPLLQLHYPPTFLVPGGGPTSSRIVTLGNDNRTYWTDFPATGQAAAWQEFGNSTLGFFPQGGVQYLPGRIMVAGGKVTGQTKTLDASSPTNNNWMPSGSLEPRFQHNLVVMPDGKVIAVGGSNNAVNSDPASTAVRRPQIWDPTTGNWTSFSGPDTLAEQPRARTHHSTCILLPDGRLLSAGGEAEIDKNHADLYCPPYLFKSNGVDLAARPVITCAPLSMAWGKTYSVQVADTTLIRAACLIRPGATTHAHDQNQRFVPVNFIKLGGPPRLLVSVPAGSDTVPPGYYMLFLTGSPDGPDVPSVARWVQVSGSAPDDVCDPVAPAAVADLSGCYHYPFHTPPQSPERQIDLAWTAPADDGTLAVTGKARQYDIRYSYQPITNETGFNNATPVGGTLPVPVPATVGTLQTHVFGNFSPNTTVYFRMKTIDDRGQYVNASAMSNQAVVYTSYDCAEGEGFYGGSGGEGGGGFRARRAAGKTSAQSPVTESAFFAENSLLNGARLGEPATDTYRLAAPPRIENGAYSVRIRAAGASAASLDVVRLLVVDHAPGAEAYNLNGTIALGSRVAAGRVTTAGGSDLTAALDGSGEVIVSAGEILTVELDPDGSDSAPAAEALMVAAKALVRQPDDAPGIVVQMPDASGWRAVDQRHLRQEFDELALGPVSGGIVRLEIQRDCALRTVGRLVPATEEPTVQWTSLLTARSSRLGDVELAVRAPDGATVALVGPDTLRLGFAVPAISDGQVREYFLVVDATRLAPRIDLAAPARAVTSPVPGRFALHQNEPNPFRASTTIRFDLPAGSMVRLEVFDVLGRRVSLLANRWYPPGFHAVEWDKKGAGGKQVGPGIYFYRIHAGPNRVGKKMLLTP